LPVIDPDPRRHHRQLGAAVNMKFVNAITGFTALMFLTGQVALAPVAAADDISLTASDGVKVHGQISRAAAPRAPVILAFHMAGSNHEEYASIVPKLNAAGFTVLAIDQRSGGSGFGSRNKTVDGLGRSASYNEALKDLDAALAWGTVEAKGAPVLAWGSSYSAALVFVLAAKHPGSIAGVLSFSPGEYLGEPDQVHTAARAIKVPVFISGSGEVDAAKSIAAGVTSGKVTHFVPSGPGVHGSSSLREDANPKGASAYWTAVLAFLKPFAPE
jgi:dienelactone hydrolase